MEIVVLKKMQVINLEKFVFYVRQQENAQLNVSGGHCYPSTSAIPEELPLLDIISKVVCACDNIEPMYKGLKNITSLNR